MTTSKPKVLFDTNVLVYNQNQDSPFYQASSHYHHQAISGKIKAHLAFQNLLEFSAILLNPKRVKKPLPQQTIHKEITKYHHSPAFRFIHPTPQTLTLFQKLLKNHSLKNPNHVFDLFLVATMLSNNIHTVLTANTKDFQFPKIKVIKLEK